MIPDRFNFNSGVGIAQARGPLKGCRAPAFLSRERGGGGRRLGPDYFFANDTLPMFLTVI